MATKGSPRKALEAMWEWSAAECLRLLEPAVERDLSQGARGQELLVRSIAAEVEAREGADAVGRTRDEYSTRRQSIVNGVNYVELSLSTICSTAAAGSWNTLDRVVKLDLMRK